MLALISVTLARLKNWRRLTPIASGSGGTHGRRYPFGGRLELRPRLLAAGERALSLDVAPAGRDVAGGGGCGFASGAVAAPRLRRQGAGPAHVRPSGHRDERDRGEDQPHGDGDGDDRG